VILKLNQRVHTGEVQDSDRKPLYQIHACAIGCYSVPPSSWGNSRKDEVKTNTCTFCSTRCHILWYDGYDVAFIIR
jgi:hypothetical protein